MKTSGAGMFIFALLIATLSASAQSFSPQPTMENEWRISENGPHHRVWERTEYETRMDGSRVPRVHRYTELAAGLNFKNPLSGEWEESKEKIEILADGSAAATNGQHKVYLPSDIYGGVIEIITPDEKHLRSRPMGISYFDGTNSVLIAVLTNSVGQVLPSANQVIWTNCFTDIACDILATYRRGGFECDLVFRGQIPSPQSFGLGRNARLQLMTEFFDSPEPEKKLDKEKSKDGLKDTVLKFGGMKMVRGKAFSLIEESNGEKKSVRFPVYKSWERLVDQQDPQLLRTFLIEELPYSNVEPELSKLGSASLRAKIANGNSLIGKVSPIRLLPQFIPAVMDSSVRIVQAPKTFNLNPSFVLDYQIMNDYDSFQDFTFEADKTYVLGYGPGFSGITTFEGGAVIKVATNGAGWFSGVKCETTPYRPVVFTAVDDDSVGETISGSQGYANGYYGDEYGVINLYSDYGDPSFKNISVNYLNAAFYSQDGPIILSNIRMAGCNKAFGNRAAIVQNGLFYQTATLLWDNASIRGTHVTIDDCQTIAEYANSVYLTNSILSFANWGNAYYYTNAVVKLGWESYPIYETAGGGRHYLKTNSIYRNCGITNIDPVLLAELKTKTTYPPTIFANTTFTSVTNFNQQVQRDVDTPDLGYHYDPLDYAFGGCSASANLTFPAGIAAGWFRTSAGWTHAGQAIRMIGNMSVSFNGTEAAPVYWVRLNTVQESDQSGGYGHGSIENWEEPAIPVVVGRFLRCSAMANEVFNGYFSDDYGSIRCEMTHSEFWAGNLTTYGDYMYFTNCLMRRVNVGLNNGNNNSGWGFRNCTFYRGSFSMSRNSSGPTPVTVRDCVFDGTTISTGDYYSGNSSLTDYDYNAFLSGSNRLFVPGAHDVTNLTSFNWQTNTLGSYYLPSNSPLTNAGSRTADLAGLYCFTTQTAPYSFEGASQVDIGYHYPSVNSQGSVVDSDGDGIPDWLDASPYDSSIGIFKVVIDKPLNGDLLQ